MHSVPQHCSTVAQASKESAQVEATVELTSLPFQQSQEPSWWGADLLSCAHCLVPLVAFCCVGEIEPNPIVSRACPDSRTSLSSLQHCSLRRLVLAPGLSHHSIASLPQPPGSLQMSATAAGTCLCPPSHFLGSLLSMPISIIPTNTTPSGLQDLRGKELSLFSVFQSLFQSKVPSPEVGQQGCVHGLLGLPWSLHLKKEKAIRITPLWFCESCESAGVGLEMEGCTCVSCHLTMVTWQQSCWKALRIGMFRALGFQIFPNGGFPRIFVLSRSWRVKKDQLRVCVFHSSHHFPHLWRLEA